VPNRARTIDGGSRWRYETLNYMGVRYDFTFCPIDCVDFVYWSYRPTIAEERPSQTFTCTAKTFNECLVEAPCSAWKRSGPKEYKLDTKIIFRGNPMEGETISGGTIGDARSEMREEIVGFRCRGGPLTQPRSVSHKGTWTGV
jgi:hypothetical protein